MPTERTEQYIQYRNNSSSINTLSDNNMKINFIPGPSPTAMFPGYESGSMSNMMNDRSSYKKKKEIDKL